MHYTQKCVLYISIDYCWALSKILHAFCKFFKLQFTYALKI